jgi:uncharacterized membrane protein YhaH (DUF805 family)
MSDFETKLRVSFLDAIKLGLKHMMNFKGRARRSEFWYWILAIFIINTVTSFFNDGSFFSLTFDNTIFIILCLISLSITVRRLHDTNHSGWWAYTCFITSITMIGITVHTLATLAMGTESDTVMLIKVFTSPIVLFVEIVFTTTTACTIVFCCMDSMKEANKYGESRKYKPI